jgi:hypothetical protein
MQDWLESVRNGSALDASRVLRDALSHIYDVNIVMRDLLSIDAHQFRRANPNEFIVWLERQQMSARVNLLPFLLCTPTEIEKERLLVQNGEQADINLSPERPASAIVPPGEVALSMPTKLRYAVIIGLKPINPIIEGPILRRPAILEQYCYKQRNFKIEQDSDATTLLRVKCDTEGKYTAP